MTHSDHSTLSMAPAAMGAGPRWMRPYFAPGKVYALLAPRGITESETFELTLAQLVRGRTQLAAVRGPSAEVAYLARIARVNGRLLEVSTTRPARWRATKALAIAELKPDDPLGELLLGGEGANRCTTLFLGVEQPSLAAATSALRAGKEAAAVALASLAVIHRPGTKRAVAAWPEGATPPLGNWTTLDPTALPAGPPATQRIGSGLMWAAAALVAAGLVIVPLRSTNAPSPSSGSPAPSAAQSASPSATEPPAAIPLPAPLTRQQAASAYDALNGRTILFGGIGQRMSATAGEVDVFDDTWTFDGHRWTQQHPLTSPGPRWGAVMGFDAASSRLLLFGGRTRAGGLVSVLGDTWSWDGSSWSQVSAPALRDAEPVGMARDARDRQLLLVTRRPIGPGPFQTWTWTGSAWRLTVPFAPSIRLVAGDPASGSVLALAIDLQTGGWATWLWNGRTWIVHQPAAPPFVEEFSPALASDPAHGDTVLVEQPFLAEDGSQQGGTLVWNGSTWVSYPNAVPDRLLNLFDKTQPVLSQGPGGRLLIVGGDRGDDSYRRVWTWDGTMWRRMS